MTQIILYEDKTLHIDGYKSIISFTSKKLCIKCSKKDLEIEGDNLRIDSFDSVSMIISGKIDDISWVN